MIGLFSYIKGYLTILVSGTFCERFLNVCATKQILLWDITRISEKSVRCKISVPAFRKLPKISYRTGVHVHILCRHGLPFVVQKYKKRKALLLFGALAALFFFTANQFVWKIEIRGNETVKTADILAALEEEGLTFGTPKWKIDQLTLKNRMLIRMPSLAWLWADKQGSKIVVDIRERIPVPEMFDPDDYCNVAASRDGVVESMIVKSGVPVVKEGDTVLAGTVLVTGKIPSEHTSEIRYIQADAQVFARVWYEKKESFSRLSVMRTETGKKKRRFTLSLFGKNLSRTKEAPFKTYDLETKKHDLSPFGKQLLALETRIYKEVTVTQEIHSAESVATQGAQMLKKQIDDETAPAASLVAVSDGYREVDDTTVEVTVRAEYLENIAVKVR